MTLPRNAWIPVRDAIVAAIVQASGFDDQRVLWAYQNANQPDDSYIDLRLSGSLNPAQDALVTTYDDTQPAGKEIRIETEGMREVVLGIEVYTSPVLGSAEEGMDALAVAEQIRSALVLPTIRDRALKFGVSFFDTFGAAQYVPSLISVGFVGRATLDVRCFVPAVAAVDYTGYISRVNGTIRVTRAGGNSPSSTAFTFSDTDP